MADIVLNTTRMSLVTETKPHERFYKANANIEKGQPCYLMSNGFIAPTSAAALGTLGTFVGIAMGPASANEAVSLLWDGSLSGFSIDALAFGAKVYLSDTPGMLSDAPGTINKAVGAILPLSDLPRTRVLYI